MADMIVDPKEKAAIKQQLQYTQEQHECVLSHAQKLAAAITNLQGRLQKIEHAEQAERERIDKARQAEQERILALHGDSLVRGTHVVAHECNTFVVGTDGSVILAGSLYPAKPSDGFASTLCARVDSQPLLATMNSSGLVAILDRGTHTIRVVHHYDRKETFDAPPLADVRQISSMRNGMVVLYENGIVMQSVVRSSEWLRLPFSEPIEQLSTAEYSMLALGKSGRVYGMGSNSHDGTIHTPELPELARSVFVTESNHAVVGVSGKLYIAGSRMARAGLGVNGYLEHSRKFEHVPLDGPVRSVALGGFHTMILLEDGRVFGCGINTEGQLGHPVRAGFSSMSREGDDPDDGTGHIGQRCRPILIPLPSKATQVACGSFHTVVLLENTQVVGFGSNKYGQIGVNALPPPVKTSPSSSYSEPADNSQSTPVPMRFW